MQLSGHLILACLNLSIQNGYRTVRISPFPWVVAWLTKRREDRLRNDGWVHQPVVGSPVFAGVMPTLELRIRDRVTIGGAGYTRDLVPVDYHLMWGYSPQGLLHRGWGCQDVREEIPACYPIV